MFVIRISGVDVSQHTLEVDALSQKQLFIDNGISVSNITIVETDDFNPVI